PCYAAVIEQSISWPAELYRSSLPKRDDNPILPLNDGHNRPAIHPRNGAEDTHFLADVDARLHLYTRPLDDLEGRRLNSEFGRPANDRRKPLSEFVPSGVRNEDNVLQHPLRDHALDLRVRDHVPDLRVSDHA